MVTIRNYLRPLVRSAGQTLAIEPRLTPQSVARLRRLRRRLFGDARLPGDSGELIRQVREGAPDGGLRLRVEFEARPPGGLYRERADEARQGLRELSLPYEVTVEEEPTDEAAPDPS